MFVHAVAASKLARDTIYQKAFLMPINKLQCSYAGADIKAWKNLLMMYHTTGCPNAQLLPEPLSSLKGC